jgi:uncharacterized protein with HEPN domain
MTRDPRLYLDEILESIMQIETYTADLTAEQYQSSRLIQDAVARRLEIIGEAVKTCRLRSRSDIATYHGSEWPVCAMYLSMTTSAWMSNSPGPL